MVVPTIAAADSADTQKAERRRLRDDSRRLMERNAWTGVEKAFQEIRRLKKVSVCWPDYLAGAQAAMNLGRPHHVISRLWGAKATMIKLPKGCDTKKNAETDDSTGNWLSATLGEYGYVDIKVKKGVTLAWENAPFEPTTRKAGDVVIEAVLAKRKYKGLMPVGTYVVKNGRTKTIKVKAANWFKSADCVAKQAKKKRPKFSKCIKKAKAQKFRIKKAKKKK